jgi:redox-sensing transcriptional repressor
MNFPSFEEMGITILAGFDSDPNKIGTVINGKSILDMKELPRYIKEYKAHIVILTVPANVAQKITDYAVESGARAIWNFAPIHINVPGDVVIEDVNMASSLAVLWHRYLNLKNID